MRHIVVDASVLVAAALKDGRVRNILLNPPEALFVAPTAIIHEITKAILKIKKYTGKSSDVVTLLVEDMLRRLVLIPHEALIDHIEEAQRRSLEADAPEDTAYVATALAIDAPIWTLDNDFERIKGIVRLKTNDLA